ncbi:MAG: MFS transporter [Verrucomicrobiales bacterium]|nr:MFS transporter [Verrucomicrobiales bacterium]
MRQPLLLALTCIGFVSLGLPDGMLGVAWPSMRHHFGLPLDAIGSVLVMFTVGYLTSSFSSGIIQSHMRLGTLLASSAFLSALSLLAYALAPHWGLIVVAAVVAGLGAGAIDSGLNAYAALHHHHGTVTWLHAAYGVGAAGSPILLGAWLSRGVPWQAGYALVAAIEIVLGLCFLVSRHRWPDAHAPAESTDPRVQTPKATFLETLRVGRLWIGILTFFVYAGIESGVGTWAFTILTTRHHLSADVAGAWVGAYWGSLAAGRVLVGLAAGHGSPSKLLVVSALGIVAGALMVLSNVGLAGTLTGILLMGASCAPVFPVLIAVTPHRLDPRHTSHAVGFQIAGATLGQSIIPAGIGIAAQHRSVETIPAVWMITALTLLVLLWIIHRHPRPGSSPQTGIPHHAPSESTPA